MGNGDGLVRQRNEQGGAVRVVTLARPERRNALNAEMLEQLRLAFDAEPPAEERVVVLRAEGTVFCSGVDLKEREHNGMAESASPIEALLATVERYPLPVVAAVQGDAIAGGNELALHCDFVVASSTARFGMSLAQIGLAPTWFLAKRLVEVGGPVFARRMLLLGDPLPAAELADLGLIHAAVDPAGLDDAVAGVVDRLAANAPLSLRAMKSVLLRQMTFRDAIEHADVDALVERARQSADAKEGIAARLAKRSPTFRGE
ncbi:MAG: enoyl-CoA hydratase/isomerase family protein [Acidimicrobiales bacterium]